VIDALNTYRTYGYSIGSTTEMLIEAADATATNVIIEDGKSGDTDFPFGNFKVLATMGEHNVCAGPWKVGSNETNQLIRDSIDHSPHWSLMTLFALVFF
jgi:hypothetical protein